MCSNRQDSYSWSETGKAEGGGLRGGSQPKAVSRMRVTVERRKEGIT